MKAPVNKEEWSESSKRSYSYVSAGTVNQFYEDIAYTCRKCSKPSIYTGEEQKIAYEVKKQYIWKRRTLCNDCFKQLEELRKKEAHFQKRWAEEKSVLSKDYRFLCDWITLLEEISSYGKRSNDSMINMLKKRAHECI